MLPKYHVGHSSHIPFRRGFVPHSNLTHAARYREAQHPPHSGSRAHRAFDIYVLAAHKQLFLTALDV